MIIWKQTPDIISFHTRHHVSIKAKDFDNIDNDMKELLFVSGGIVVLFIFYKKRI